MAQRGGSVISHIRIGKKIFSPLVSKEEADILVAMELKEACRCVEYIRPGSLMMFLEGPREYPEDLKNKIKKRCKKVLEISYSEITNCLKNIKTVNIFMLGALSNYFSIKKEYWSRAIREKVPLETRDLNLAAFELGRKKFHNNKKFNL